ncbi:hypothetical protein [Synechococcus phage BUCT-ZZ01]|nr:hypothetical protein [Synechococcus phage BUCT-ZZ01]
MRKRDKQRVFDKVAVHLLTQREQSNSNGTCVYRGKDRLMCAAGVLIPTDIDIPEDFNSTDWDGLIHHIKYPKDKFTKILAKRLPLYYLESSAVAFVQELQHIHDHKNPSEWPTYLIWYAEDHKLSTEKIVHLL